jgi:hypothetical protein
MRDLAQSNLGIRDSIGSVAIVLSVFVMATSMIDLFVNRLLFRAGPEVLREMSFPGISTVAVLGSISFNFEQFILYVILGGAAVLLFRERSLLSRNLGFLLIPQLASAALLYLPLSQALSWAFSMALVLLTGVEVFGLIILRARTSRGLSGRELAGARFFEVALGAAFFLPLYSKVSVLLVGLNLPGLPGQMDAYLAGVYVIVAASVAAFVYAMTARTPGYRMGVRGFAMAALLPTLLAIPILIGLMESFLMTQIMSMVIAMSTDIILDFQLVRVVTVGWWFVMMAIFVLWFKARGSHDMFFLQQGLGLTFILSMTLLFNYPNYLLLGTAGVLLICYPLRKKEQEAA